MLHVPAIPVAGSTPKAALAGGGEVTKAKTSDGSAKGAHGKPGRASTSLPAGLVRAGTMRPVAKAPGEPRVPQLSPTARAEAAALQVLAVHATVAGSRKRPPSGRTDGGGLSRPGWTPVAILPRPAGHVGPPATPVDAAACSPKKRSSTGNKKGKRGNDDPAGAAVGATVVGAKGRQKKENAVNWQHGMDARRDAAGPASKDGPSVRAVNPKNVRNAAPSFAKKRSRHAAGASGDASGGASSAEQDAKRRQHSSSRPVSPQAELPVGSERPVDQSHCRLYGTGPRLMGWSRLNTSVESWNSVP